jgi:pimeloyl-ACP methyl ester carboxylesterase
VTGEWKRARDDAEERGRRRRPSRYEFSKVTMEFESGGETCSGWLYRPDRPADPPLVVMAGGIAAERTFGLPEYAERLAEAGYAVFLFDFRNHGASDGDPRNLVSPGRQRGDWEAALAGLRGRDDVATDDVVLWGVDLAGGQVVDVAADDVRVRAVVSQTPVLSGRALLTNRGYGFLAKGVLAGVRDRLQSLVTDPHTVPVAGDPDDFALLSTPGVRADYLGLVPPDSDWENETPARSFLSLARFSAGEDAEMVSCPVLLVAGTRDDVTSPDVVETVAESVADATVVRLPVGHYDFYGGDALDQTVGHALAFLDAVVSD